MVTEQLGPYRIEALLGAGGMGEVYRARDTRLDRAVAVKISKEQFTDRFEREARAVAALNHPHICTLHDVGPNYLVMELVEGQPLKGPLPVEKAVEPNPRWVAYQSDESGRIEVYIQAFPEPRGKWQISTGGGMWPQWGTGGRELFYVSTDSKLMVVSLAFGADSVTPSAPRALFAVHNTGVVSPYEVSADGQRFLVTTPPEQAPQPLNVIVNWPALLKSSR